jgi:hypothetical protein
MHVGPVIFQFNYTKIMEWDFTRVSYLITSEPTVATGCGWGDYDNDGMIDLFICTLFGLNNQLYRNDGNGNLLNCFGNIVRWWIKRSCLWLDYDKDGWLDLFVLNQGMTFIP